MAELSRVRSDLPPHLLAALVPLLVVLVALDVWCLVDLLNGTHQLPHYLPTFAVAVGAAALAIAVLRLGAREI